MGELILDAVWSVFNWFVRIFLHLTGESLRWVFTLGHRRMRWWDAGDDNVAWPSIVVGIAFWMAVGALVWHALR